jgi:hypothetical protein
LGGSAAGISGIMAQTPQRQKVLDAADWSIGLLVRLHQR